ncbi:plasminogen-like [Rhopilema esculentum]|uniref:plasminogen-like n=1 Tax=Rhopilema esculentum TaxID=499914 RepID=UPI0031DB8C32
MFRFLLLLILGLQALREAQSQGCSDSANHARSCPGWIPYCKSSSNFYAFMQINCKKTCGFCPVNGGYSAWGPYGACSVSCGGGTKTRSRKCNNPAPKNNGRPCTGPSTQTAVCNSKSCPVGQDEVCADSAKVRSACPTWKTYCKKGSRYYDYMKANCKKSCGFCVASCEDEPSQVKNCPLYKPYCKKDSKYYSWMQNNCKKTCGFCKTEQKKCGLRGLSQWRVIGGVVAEPHTWPWSVALLKFGTYFCGGSLIDNQWVLTAAHCLFNREHQADFMEVVLGEHDRTLDEGSEKKVMIEKIINHPDYNSRTLNNDIALIKLKEKVELKFTALDTPDKIGVVCLPEAMKKAKIGQKCYITGWGKTKHPGPSSNVLMEAEMPVVTNEVCKKQNNVWGGADITSKMLCAGNKPGTNQGGCHGDSGGPYVCTEDGEHWTLTGVVSWGSSTCDRADKYTVFARVSEFITWIEKTKKAN